ncbi:MAG: NADH-quinone oxidoreductase subunit L [Burkholderiales bacterium]|nr:NADH-quinone oxidoreductase subunit L [Burkholderiales bacterium]
MKALYLIIPFAPLVGSILAGLFGKQLGRLPSAIATILGVLVAFIGSVIVFNDVRAGNVFNGSVYTWAQIGGLHLEVGFLIDNLTTMMMCVVTFVSLMVHIYTMGYMAEDPGYQRFFSYISLFTFSMLMLVMSNNFLQLFFGWEAVGLVSYLLIGFWYTRPTAIFANMKAFLVNRVGDFGFVLGIGLIYAFAGTLDYAQVFAKREELAAMMFPGMDWMLITVICICLFIGAMGKSAQVPLHVWLPDSMEGPTPISALIHAATMVTAGIFMVTRMSPLFELSDTALSFVLIIGSITALFMGFLGIIQNDVKRVVAYSTLSQLGYMTVALGVSAYSVAVFHLMTHAFFKALLFLGAGSVIMGMHHDQDMRNMGGLRKYMPITWITSLIGSLALIGTPFFSGFYSKDSIIEAAAEAMHAHQVGATFAYYAVLAGVFITAFYSFRMYFMVFHGKERWMNNAEQHMSAHGHDGHDAHDAHDEHADHDEHHHGLGPNDKPHESPWVVTVPLILLAIPSVIIGLMTIEPMLFGEFFKGVITIDAERHPAMEELAKVFEHHGGAVGMAMHAISTAPFWLALAGVVTAYVFYMLKPSIPAAIKAKTPLLNNLLENKYYFDKFNEVVIAGGARKIGEFLWKVSDTKLIDGLVVNGAAKVVNVFAQAMSLFQSGLIYQYAFAMVIGLAFFLLMIVTL